jgi:hypothetical protein
LKADSLHNFPDATNKKPARRRVFCFHFRFHRRGLKRRSEMKMVDPSGTSWNRILDALSEWNQLLSSAPRPSSD